MIPYSIRARAKEHLLTTFCEGCDRMIRKGERFVIWALGKTKIRIYHQGFCPDYTPSHYYKQMEELKGRILSNG